jgi:hypothetical protein
MGHGATLTAGSRQGTGRPAGPLRAGRATAALLFGVLLQPHTTHGRGLKLKEKGGETGCDM